MLRRNFCKISLFAASVLVSSTLKASILNSSNKTKIVILGGGYAGLSAAKYLKELNPMLDVTLIEKRSNFISCPLSNAWLGGIKGITYVSLNFDYNSSVEKYKYNFINETILDINRKTKEIKTNQQTITYDYMIMALGIDYNYNNF